jgi:hypothetical protein
MKKVGLVTCYIDNFGACLQAYALQRVIIKQGNMCEIIRYTPNKDLSNTNKVVKIIKYIWRKLRSITNETYSYELSRKSQFKLFREKFLIFGRTHYDNIDMVFSNIPQYDSFVVGSDQLWNPLIHSNSNNSVYFLDFVQDDKKRIAYAPSIGLSILPDIYKDEMARMLMKFDTLSVREQEGANIVEEITGRPCRVVLDPTLLLARDEWYKIAAEPIPKIEEPYIFCYLFGNGDYIGEFVEYVKQKTNYKVVLVPYTKREYDSSNIKIKKAGPHEFIGLIKNASLVITDSFHATAFSINFNIPFYSLLRNSTTELNNMNSRITNILGMVGLENRLIMSVEDFPAEINLEIDFTAANQEIAKRREEDIRFLRDAIGGGKLDAKKANL